MIAPEGEDDKCLSNLIGPVFHFFTWKFTGPPTQTAAAMIPICRRIQPVREAGEERSWKAQFTFLSLPWAEDEDDEEEFDDEEEYGADRKDKRGLEAYRPPGSRRRTQVSQEAITLAAAPRR